MIYFLRAGPAVKIGYTENPLTAFRRLAGFQTANHEPLTLLAVAEGDRRREAELHRRFAAYRLRGEWYAADQVLLDFAAAQAYNQAATWEIPMTVPETATPTQLLSFVTLAPTTAAPPRLSSSLRGLDAVLGGGFVPGSTTLLSGDPGAGKSTMLLQVAAYVACRGYAAVYVTAEEAAGQVQLRAERLGLAPAPVALAAVGDVRAVIAACQSADHGPLLLIIDSLQTFTDPTIVAARGTPSQTRAVLAALIAYAHATGAAVVVISHVNKASRASGSNDLQHDVDVLLHLHAIADRRVLRARKNRFGPTDVTATFRMTRDGVREAA